MNARYILEFALYLQSCTDSQVMGCWEREREAGRDVYAALCEAEANRRRGCWDLETERFDAPQRPRGVRPNVYVGRNELDVAKLDKL
jgi:hypothetical protein